MRNPSEQFRDALQSAGLIPGAITPDGRWHRCPTESHPRSRNGSYKLSVEGTFGIIQDWANYSGPMLWRPEAPIKVSPACQASIQRRRAEERQRIATAIRSARGYFDACQRLRDGHPYLVGKNLGQAGCSGLRVDIDGWLVVPMFVNGSFSSVQRISPDGNKRFWPDAPTSGASYTIERRSAPLTILCEGLATGLCIFAAVPTARVVVAFNAGNLVRVAEALPRRGMAVVAADNDLATETRTGINPGVKAAQEAAVALGCGIAIPTGISGTDWLDFRNEKVAERKEACSRERVIPDSEIRRAVDAEITVKITKCSSLLREGNSL